MIKKAIRTLLLSKAGVTSGLATYGFTTGEAEEAAIFTGRKIPEDAEYRCIWVNGVTGSDFGVRSKQGAEMFVDVHVYADKNENDNTIEAFAWTVREALNRGTLTLDGYSCLGLIADPPLQTNDPSLYPGYTIRTKAIILQA